MVQTMDEAIGRITDAIDEAGIADNTIIVFFSDNGGVFWKHPVAFMHDEYKNIPPTNNSPLRDGKATLYEGGTREPCIVIWPGKVKPATRCEQVISSVDFYPTILEMTGLSRKAGLKLDGVSIVPALEGRALGREAIFCHFPHYTPMTGARPGTYVRKGDWKLIRYWADNDDQTDRPELYNLREDQGERNNLAASMPDKVKELGALMDAFLRDTNAVIPKPNPSYRKQAVQPFELPNPDDVA
jgi:arylsulfatase A-like enzyme